MSAADFLLSPEVQKLLRIVYAEPSREFLVGELAKMSKLDLATAEGTLLHLVTSGMLTKCKPEGDAAESFSANLSFVFYDEMRSIALKSFAAAEPIRAALRSKFNNSVLRAFVLGEGGPEGAVELLIVHGHVAPDEVALKAALQKLVKAISRQLQVHVMSHGEFDKLGPRDELARKLAAKSAFEIISLGDTNAKLPIERVSLLQKAKRHLAALAA